MRHAGVRAPRRLVAQADSLAVPEYRLTSGGLSLDPAGRSACATSALRTDVKLFLFQSAGHELRQIDPALHQRGLAPRQAAFEGAVLHFDADRAGVADIAEHGEEFAPIDVAEAGQFGGVI